MSSKDERRVSKVSFGYFDARGLVSRIKTLSFPFALTSELHFSDTAVICEDPLKLPTS